MDAKVFLMGGCASTAATLFTNPLEVVKTRMQLQGELASRGQYVESYRNVFHAFFQVAKHDGITGLQKGLGAAVVFQFMLNALRLGIYNNAVAYGLTKNRSGKESFLWGGVWGGIGGVVGSSVASPFYLIKTQLQSQAVNQIAVGYQHKHKGMAGALKDIYRKDGFTGLYRGVNVTIPRGFLGSGGQLATFGYTKAYFKENGYYVDSPLTLTFMSGAVAGTVMTMTITPPDVIATRLYNQGVDAHGKGIFYKGVFDCFWKILKTEGIFGLYKGFWAQYFRMGPHATLVLFFFDEMNRYWVNNVMKAN